MPHSANHQLSGVTSDSWAKCCVYDALVKPVPTSKSHLQVLLKEQDPDLRSELILTRLITRAKDHGFCFLTISRKRIGRGYSVLIDDSLGTFLPLLPGEVSEFDRRVDCFVGSVKGSGEEWLQRIREKLGEVQLGYRPMSLGEDLLVRSIL